MQEQLFPNESLIALVVLDESAAKCTITGLSRFRTFVYLMDGPLWHGKHHLRLRLLTKHVPVDSQLNPNYGVSKLCFCYCRYWTCC
jgi:hypothetical protein